MRAARLRPGARQPLAAKGLRADNSADLVAVDVNIADFGARRNALHTLIDAAVNTQRQAIAARIDGFDDLIELVRRVAHQMQHRAENFLFQLIETIQLEHAGRYIITVIAKRRRRDGLMNQTSLSGQFFAMPLHRGQRISIN